jgi:hypothetical protein
LLDFVIKGQERQQRQVAPAVVVGVEERELLRAVSGVVGRVEIDRDLSGPPAQSSLMPRDHRRREFAPHRIQFLDADVIFEARDRRLRRERVSGDWVPQQLVNRVVGEPIRVVGIGMPAGQPENSLRQQLAECVPNLRRLAIVDQTARKSIDQTVLPFGGFQQNGAAIGAGVLLVEGRNDRFVE